MTTIDEVLDGLPELIPSPRFADLFGVSPRTVRTWIANGRIVETFRTADGGSGRVLIPRSEARRILGEMRR